MTSPCPQLDSYRLSLLMASNNFTGESQEHDYASIDKQYPLQLAKLANTGLAQNEFSAPFVAGHTGATDFTGAQPMYDPAFYPQPAFPLLQQGPNSGFHIPNHNHAGVWYNTASPDGRQFRVLPFIAEPMDLPNEHIDLGLEGFQMPDTAQGFLTDPTTLGGENTHFGLDGSHMSYNWMNHDTVQGTAPSNQGLPIMHGLNETQFDTAYGLTTTPAAAIVSSTTVGEHSRCHKGCPKTFGRPGDYRRHMKKHALPRFKCVMFDCDKTFYRADKVRDHIKQGHKNLNFF